MIQGLMADRAWGIPAAGGSVLDQWPAIAAAISPNLPTHVQAVAFRAKSRAAGPARPDSPAYGIQLRLLNARVVAATNDAAGTQAVRSIRVLAVGAVSPMRTVESEMASHGFPQALAAYQAAAPAQRVDPGIAEAVERQTKAMRELSRRAFPVPEPNGTPASGRACCPARSGRGRSDRQSSGCITAGAYGMSRAEGDLVGELRWSHDELTGCHGVVPVPRSRAGTTGELLSADLSVTGGV